MGEMIANIAHQWRQPLSVISAGATGMKMQKELDCLTDEVFLKTCNMMNENAQYLSQTIEDFRNYIKSDQKKVFFNIGENIKTFLSLIQSSITTNNIKIVFDKEVSFNIESYSNELIQCYINIFNIQKMHFIENNIENKYFFIDVSKDTENLYIIFKDNAGGISNKILTKVFEPYFTTKHKTQGTGLGLYMTHNLITKKVKGKIKISNINFEYKKKNETGIECIIQLPII